MDAYQVKSLAWILCLGAGALALVAACVSIFGRGNRPPGWAKPATTAVGGALVLFAVAAIVLSLLPHGTGARGAAAAAALGLLLVPVASLVASLCNQHSDYRPAHEDVDIHVSASWSLVPCVFLLGGSLLGMGLISHHYGIRAYSQFQALVLGTTAGLLWTMLAFRATSSWDYADHVIGTLSAAALAAVALPWSTAMAAHHFSDPATAPWFPILVGVGILAGWTLSVVAVAVMSHGQGSRSSAIASALILAVALGASAFSAQASLVRKENLLPALAAGFLGALFLLTVTSSTQALLSAEESPEDLDRAPVDAMASAAVVLILGGVAWVGFKLLLGLGVLVATLGFLAAYPAAVALGVSSPARGSLRLPERAAALGGGFLLLLGGMKLLGQEGGLILSGIDVAEGNVAMALIVGTIFPLLLEATTGRRPFREGVVQTSGPIAAAAGRCLAVLVLTGCSVVGGALYFGIDGAGAMALGISLFALLAATSAAAAAHEEGLMSLRTVALAPAFVALAILLLPFKDMLLEVTRIQKQEIITGIAVASALTLTMWGAIRGRTGPAAAGAPLAAPAPKAPPAPPEAPAS